MDNQKEPKSRRVIAWLGLVWGSLMLLSALFRDQPPERTQMYMTGQSVGLLMGFLMVCAGVYYLFMRKL